MNLQEFYDIVGGNYSETVSRMMGEAMLRRFLLKFPADPNFDALEQAIAADDREAAFRAAHTIKGLCLNLGLGKLLYSAEVLTEALRNEMPGNVAELFAPLKENYELTLDAVLKL